MRRMERRKTIVVKVGQKFLHKPSRSLLTVVTIKDKNFILVKEDGTVTICVQASFFSDEDLEPLYD
jgi:hypothetical protein